MTDAESPADLRVPVSGQDHALGPEDAVLELLMYGDYECPYTAMAHALMLELREALGDRMRFVYRNFPLWNIHPHAMASAIAAEAAGAEGRFWQMHHQLFTHQEALEAADLLRHAEAVGLDPARFAFQLSRPEHQARVQEDLQSGEASGVHSTPTFFINGRRHREKFNLQALVEEIFAVPGVQPEG